MASEELHNLGVAKGDTSVSGSSGLRFPESPTEEAPLGVLEHYQIQELVGSGSSGLLYRAIDSRVNRVVAIKVLRAELAGHEEFRKRFQREAHAVAGLNHEGIVKLYKFVDTAEFPPYLVMEYVEGRSIAQLFKQRKVIPVRESVALAIPIARALAKAHELDLVHRDIKPSNILIGENNQTKVTDFGLALLDDGNASLTREGALAGTPAYISPEQIQTPHEVDGRADVYSLGVVLYQMLTGQLPFQGVARMILLAVQHNEPPSPIQYNDEIPKDVETIVLKALSKDPDKRYETATAMADDLQRWIDGEPIHARPVGSFERFSRWCKRNSGIAKLSAIVAALLVTMTVGAAIASFNLSAAKKETETQRDRAISLVESLINELHDSRLDGSQVYPPEALLEISLQGLREITDREEELGGLDYSVAKAHLLVADSLHWLHYNEPDTLEEVRFHLEAAGQILEKLGGEDSDQWPVVELYTQLKVSESSVFSFLDDARHAEKTLIEALLIAQKAQQRWPDSFEVHLALAKTQATAKSFNSVSTELERFVDPDVINRTLKELQQKEPGNQEVLGLLMEMNYSQAVKIEYSSHVSSQFLTPIRDQHDAFAHYLMMIDSFGIFLKHYESLDARGLATAQQHQMALDVYHSLGKSHRYLRDKDTSLEYLGKFMDLLHEQHPYEYSLSEVDAVQQYIAESKKQFDETRHQSTQ